MSRKKSGASRERKKQAYVDPIERLRGVVLDRGPYAPPSPNMNDLYIGRLLAGSSCVVDRLRGELVPEHTIEAFGQLVVPYTYRRILAGHPKAREVVGSSLLGVHSKPVTTLTIGLNGPYYKEQYRNKSFSVRIHFIGPSLGIMAEEAARARFPIEHELEIPKETAGQAILIRAYEADSVEEANAAIGIIDGFWLNEIELTVPVVCGAPKKAA